MSVARVALWTAALVVTATVGLMVSPAARAADVGVSISVSQPGVYGRIDIGRFPQPEVLVAQPVWVQRPRVVAQPVQPVYLWVPPGHQKNWGRHCSRYRACGVPVYFVKDEWYQAHVAQSHHRGDDDDDRRGPPGHSKGHGKGRGHD